MTRYELATEIFSLPRGSEHLVYAPLQRTSLLVNGSALNLLADIAAERSLPRDRRTREVLELLLELDLIAPKGRRPAAGASGSARQPATPAPRELPAVDSEPILLRPTACTLFLTTACNLRCLYCYASGGERPRHLDERIARDAIDFVVNNAVASEVGEVTVAFHGGGEPTLAGESLVHCVDYARKRCRQHGLELSTGVATNGVMGDAMRDYLADTMTSVMVSVDGQAAVQDRLRPRADGGPSSAAVERTLERLSAGACTVGARLTCTSDSIEHAPEAVRHLAGDFKLTTIHLEPLFACGRSLHHDLQPPSPDRFVDIFRRCRALAAEYGVTVVYSGARQPSLAHAFCQASGPSFNVTSDGDVTACYEVSGRDDPRAETFLYGSYDPELRSFAFDAARIAALRRLTVDDAPRCARCFCKYHCAGDCASKRLYPGGEAAVAARCQINRSLTRDQLEDALLGVPVPVGGEALKRG